MKKTQLNLWAPFLIVTVIFLGIKLHSLGVRASDTNIYFYTAKELLAGKVLYRDIFFTNFPLIPYMAAIYFILSGGNLLFYYFTATFESLITGGLIYYLAFHYSSSRLTAITTTCLYLFSFMLLSTSDHQTGVFLAALFITTSYLCLVKKRYLLMGILTALAILTKAYSLPLVISYVVFLFLTDRKQLLPFISGGIATATVVMLPSLLLAPEGLIKDVFNYSLTRSQGISKVGIMYFVIQHDFFFLLLLGVSLFSISKKNMLGFFTLFSILFFTLYKDVYYLYLNITLPILVLSLPLLIQLMQEKISLNRFLIPTIIGILCLYNLASYFSGYDTLQKMPMSELSQALRQTQSSILYGVNGITPALAYTNDFKLLNGIVDTNDNIFRKGYLNAASLTHDAITQHAIIVTQGVWYPALGVTEDTMTEIVDKKLLTEHCHILKRFPFQSEGIINSINLFTC